MGNKLFPKHSRSDVMASQRLPAVSFPKTPIRCPPSFTPLHESALLTSRTLSPRDPPMHMHSTLVLWGHLWCHIVEHAQRSSDGDDGSCKGNSEETHCLRCRRAVVRWSGIEAHLGYFTLQEVSKTKTCGSKGSKELRSSRTVEAWWNGTQSGRIIYTVLGFIYWEQHSRAIQGLISASVSCQPAHSSHL